MEEQYITEKCFNKLHQLFDILKLINPSLKISASIRTTEEYITRTYYVLFVRYSDSTAPIEIVIDEYWLYTESFYSFMGKVIDEICKAMKRK